MNDLCLCEADSIVRSARILDTAGWLKVERGGAEARGSHLGDWRRSGYFNAEVETDERGSWARGLGARYFLHFVAMSERNGFDAATATAEDCRPGDAHHIAWSAHL
jgi:hypothetical protein